MKNKNKNKNKIITFTEKKRRSLLLSCFIPLVILTIAMLVIAPVYLSITWVISATLLFFTLKKKSVEQVKAQEQLSLLEGVISNAKEKNN